MQTRSPAIARVCNAAVAHFAERGYDAASLNEIAEAIGIRKASLYSHFSSKDELFMAVFFDALRCEQDYASQCFAHDGKSALPGSGYCTSLAGRYAESVHLRFLF